MQRGTHAHALFLYWSIGRLARGVGFDRQHRLSRQPVLFETGEKRKKKRKKKRTAWHENIGRQSWAVNYTLGSQVIADWSVWLQDSIICDFINTSTCNNILMCHIFAMMDQQRGGQERKETGSGGYQWIITHADLCLKLLRVPHCSLQIEGKTDWWKIITSILGRK